MVKKPAKFTPNINSDIIKYKDALNTRLARVQVPCNFVNKIMNRFLHDLFFPHQNNNFRSRLLHHKSIIFLIALILFSGFFLSALRTNYPKVLGISYDITSNQLLYFTNIQRQQIGAGSLSLNDKLTQAAGRKAKDMFAENYWAHNSPTGKTPWVFIKDSGYTYVYAGENLARGFQSSDDVVKAWMASPDHRENMLSKNYSDVGFSVAKGKLLGEETVLIVEMLGSTTLSSQKGSETAISPPISSQNLVLSKSENPLINSVSLSKNLALGIIFVFLIVLILDMFVVERRKITRFVGHNLDHIFYFTLILLIVIIIARGLII